MASAPSITRVRRYVNRLTSSKQLPVRRIEVEPGYEMQIDYGQGARCRDHTGKLRKTYLFLGTESFS